MKQPQAQKPPPPGPQARPPVPMVVGMGRSGTTLLRMMLDSYPDLAVPPETNFGEALHAFEQGGAEAALEAILADERWEDYNMPTDEFSRRVRGRRPETLSDLLRIFFELYAELRGKSRWGNKTPHYLPGMRRTQELFPESRFVHVVRDGRDVALSIVPLWFGANDVAGVARGWSRMLESAREQAPDLHFYMEIHYEHLVREPAATLRRLCEFLELEWDPAMLAYHEHAGDQLSAELGDVVEGGRLVRAAERHQIFRLVGSPPRADRAEAWRREMDPADVAVFEQIAGETLKAFGYEIS